MAECMNPEDWLSTIKKEYLQDFIRREDRRLNS